METIFHVVKIWQQYLIERHFKARIDHDSLKYILEQRVLSKEKKMGSENVGVLF